MTGSLAQTRTVKRSTSGFGDRPRSSNDTALRCLKVALRSYEDRAVTTDVLLGNLLASDAWPFLIDNNVPSLTAQAAEPGRWNSSTHRL